MEQGQPEPAAAAQQPSAQTAPAPQSPAPEQPVAAPAAPAPAAPPASSAPPAQPPVAEGGAAAAAASRGPSGDVKRASFSGEADAEEPARGRGSGIESKKKGSQKSKKAASEDEEEESEAKKTPSKRSSKSKKAASEDEEEEEGDGKKTPSKHSSKSKKQPKDDEGFGRESNRATPPKSSKKKKAHKAVDASSEEEGEERSGRESSPGRGHGGGSAKKQSKAAKSPSSKSRRGKEDDDYSDDFDEYDSDDRRNRRNDRKQVGGHKKDRGYDSRSGDDDEYYEDDYYDEGASDMSRAKYEGDISAWGRKTIPGFYDKRRGGSVTSESDCTMSSGLSPRDGEGRPFDLEGAKNTLAYNAGLFGKAQAMRKEGKAPKTFGIADDLPDRFAYHQLQQLAGMARKVQDAIQHNTRVFELRVLSEDMHIKKKCFHGWRAARYGTLAKQQLLQRVLARMMRSRLAKAFFAWKDRFGIVDKNFAMRRKLQATLNKGRMRRAFLGWRKVLTERGWKTQLETRDSRIHTLEKKIAGFELRPIMVIRRRRLDAMLTAWFNLSADRRRRRMRFEKAGKHFMNRQLASAWNTWFGHHLECQRQGNLLSKAAGRMKNLKLARSYYKWYDLILEKRAHELKAGKALKHWKNQGLSKAWSTWWEHVVWRREKKKIIGRWMQPMKAKAFYTWVDHVQWRKRMRVVMDRTARRMRNAGMARAFDAWRTAVEGSKVDFHLTKKEELAVQVKALSEENERLRRDNERFVRLIDSGEWGRGRVSELVSAGEVLKGERDALMKLIQGMRREYEAVQGAKGAQEDELRRLKERMLLGGAARNKLLVKGASSYNALKRAIKQDLVDAGGAPQDPNLLYEIDKLSLERVSVFPDGDINIEAVSTAPGSAAFSKPVSSAQALRSSVAPAYPMHVPQGLPGGSRGPSANAARPTARTIEILNRLQGLTPAELDRVEDRLRAEAIAKAGGAGGEGRGPAGMSSSSRR